MQQTETYKFSLIEGGDRFSPQPLNDNMDKVEQALKDCAQTVTALADSSVKMAFGDYSGTGAYGSTTPTALTFDFEPKLLVVSSGNNLMIALRGNQNAACYIGLKYMSNYADSTYGWYNPIVWDGHTVSWHNTGNNTSQFNQSGVTYRYVAFG